MGKIKRKYTNRRRLAVKPVSVVKIGTLPSIFEIVKKPWHGGHPISNPPLPEKGSISI